MKLLFLPFFILLKAQRSGVRGKRSSTTAAKLDVSAKSQKSLEFFKFILSQKSDNLLPNFSVTNIGTVLLRNYVECAQQYNCSEAGWVQTEIEIKATRKADSIRD